GPTALAVVLDNSMSTTVVESGHPLIAHLERMARDAFARSAPGDRLWLVTADGVARAGSAGQLEDAVQRVSPLGGAGNPALALQRATAAVQGSGLRAQQVALLTDGQKTAWRAAPNTGRVPVVAWVPNTVPPENHAVVSAEAQPVRWTPRGAVTARVLARDSTTYRIVLGNRTLARGTAAPGEEIMVRAAPPERGWMAGTVELDADELPADNVRHFAAWIGPATGVSAAPDAGPFVTRLPALIVAPTDPVRLGAANRALERAGVPWRFGAARQGVASLQGDQMDGAQVSLRYALQPTTQSAADTLATAGTEPWIVAGARYVLVASPLAPQATTFPVSAGFVPWLADVMANRLVGDPGRALPAAPGQLLPWPAWADAIEGGAAAGTPGGDFTAPEQAGTYFFTRNQRRVGALVVNPEPGESVLDRWNSSGFAQLLGRGASVSSHDAHFSASLFDVSARRSLAVPLLVALLVALAFEAVVTARGAMAEG
ncbi:MAG: hypothetical protein B7Z72_10230, partial [Gemmatimonadetes bacterium 21-71-4]